MPASEQHFATSIMTSDGGRFDYARARDPENVPSVEALAHHLALANRFCGATRVPYSVAEHAVRVSWLCEQAGGSEMCGLHHDDPEATTADIPRPAKKLLPDFQALEQASWLGVARRFGLPEQIPRVVHWADAVLLVTEGRDLCHPDWPLREVCDALDVEPLEERIVPLDWWEAREAYIARHYALVVRQQQQAEEA